MQQKSCQKCPPSTLKFIPPAVATQNSSTSSHHPHLLFMYQTWSIPTVKLPALTVSNEHFGKAQGFSFLGTLLREAKGCFCIKERICDFIAGWGMTRSTAGCLELMCSAAAPFPDPHTLHFEIKLQKSLFKLNSEVLLHRWAFLISILVTHREIRVAVNFPCPFPASCTYRNDWTSRGSLRLCPRSLWTSLAAARIILSALTSHLCSVLST